MRVTAHDLTGIPPELVPYFDLRGRGVVDQQDVKDVVDFFDRIPPGNRNGIADGPEIDAIRNFVHSKSDVRLINQSSADRIAGELRTQVLTWANDTKLDFVRIQRFRDRAEGRYLRFAKADSKKREVAMLVGNLIWASSIAVLINVAAVLVPFAVVVASEKAHSRAVLKSQELTARLEEFHELRTASKVALVEETRDDLLAKIDECAGSPEALRDIRAQVQAVMERPKILTEDEVYRTILLYHARARKIPVVGSSENLDQRGQFYVSKDRWNPLRLNGAKIAKELNGLPQETQHPVDTMRLIQEA